MANLNDILRNALTLDIQERASLAEQLLASLDELGPSELGRIWENEAEKRLRDVKSGTARTISSDKVHQKAKRILDRS